MGPGPGPWEKADPAPLEKESSMLKFTALVNKSSLTNSRVVISNMAVVFSICCLEISKQSIFCPKIFFFVLHETLHFEKLRSADFKYDNLQI